MANDEPPFDAAALAELCNAAGQPMMAATLIREGVTLEAARARLDYAGGVRSVVTMATRMAPHLALPEDYVDDAIREHKPVADLRRELFDRMADADESLTLDAHRRTGDGSDVRRASASNMDKLVREAGMQPVKPRR